MGAAPEPPGWRPLAPTPPKTTVFKSSLLLLQGWFGEPDPSEEVWLGSVTAMRVNPRLEAAQGDLPLPRDLKEQTAPGCGEAGSTPRGCRCDGYSEWVGDSARRHINVAVRAIGQHVAAQPRCSGGRLRILHCF